MENEAPFRKKCIGISGSVFAILSFAVSLFWLIRADSANTMDDDFTPIEEDTRIEIDTHAFDLCAGFEGTTMEDWLEICGKEGCFDKTSEINTNWHTIFEYNGVVMIFLTFSYLLVAIGSCSVYARVMGSLCATCWNCCNIICLMVTPAYRFSKQGQLCALTTAPSGY